MCLVRNPRSTGRWCNCTERAPAAHTTEVTCVLELLYGSQYIVPAAATACPLTTHLVHLARRIPIGCLLRLLLLLLLA